jgi:hypothetical protein
MKNSPIFYLPLILAALTLTSSVQAQSMGKFQVSNLEVSGGENNVTNTGAAIYSGNVNISSNGIISGTILRRDFAHNKTNSSLVRTTIQTSNSKMFGTILKEGTFTNVWTNDYSRTTSVDTIYRADFYIATSLSNFFIKGRATQRSTRMIEVYNDGEGAYTNTNSYTSVSLGGVSFGAGQARGVFAAD